MHIKKDLIDPDGSVFLKTVKGYLENEIETEDEYTKVLSWAFSKLDFEQFAYVYMPYLPSEAKNAVILGSYPSGWQLFYKSEGLHRKDPVLAESAGTTMPFYWRGGRIGIGDQEDIFKLSARYGIEQGYTIPVHEPGCSFGSIHLASRLENDEFYKLIDSQGHLLQCLASLAHIYRPATARKLPYADLSLREREFLHWSSQGKTYQEAGIIMGISERTVKFHAQNCMRKLEAINVRQAITKALRLGWV
ncbi:LuxR family transcriptional regulator [Halomonas sp. I5-271120]|uniref:helix-turn-helix transcriptional regulator n=1 Tax=Halomonas sp. I5-271120 TaxID=3061632 RepID=UPI002714F45F|nr:LuxR family transcriptional regulator [Halomonas sp. I5-271120]